MKLCLSFLQLHRILQNLFFRVALSFWFEFYSNFPAAALSTWFDEPTFPVRFFSFLVSIVSKVVDW